ncbi:MAG TPA: alpha/beta fold hydrolase [Dehalococcoidia bacterium]|nr:alpha/beta fold hydrolase [Dehalococcoidia bacterium]
MEQQIRFCTTPDGARLAYAAVGQGPALVIPPGWVAHLELQWRDANWRAFVERIARHHTVVKYDKRGCGLSDRNRTDFSPDSEVRDLEAIIDHLKARRLALFGISQGGPTAIAYAARYPRRVTHLILYATYARGSQVSTEEMQTSMISLVRSHWGVASRTMADLFNPGTDAAALEASAAYQRQACTAEMAAKLLDLTYKADVTHLLPNLRVPTLVLHRERERAIPFRCGRELAALIPDARFAPLEGNIHPPHRGDTESVLQAIFEFLGEMDSPPAAAAAGQPAGQPIATTPGESVAREAQSLIAGLDYVSLSRFRVVGNFTCYQEEVRHHLKDVRQKIADGFSLPGRKRENHLIWAAPGSGKTYLVQQIAASLQESVGYQELNLAACNEPEFVSSLAQLRAEEKPHLCLVDEIDAKPHESWPYATLLPCLDETVAKGRPCVFVLAGSSGSCVAEMKERIASQPKGADLLNRIPAWNEYEIPSLSLGDRALVVLTQFRQAGKEIGREIQSVEKLGLYYIILNSRLNSARQLRELAVRAVERLPSSEDRVKYDHLFGAGDPENKEFWIKALPEAKDLANRFVTLED